MVDSGSEGQDFGDNPSQYSNDSFKNTGKNRFGENNNSYRNKADNRNIGDNIFLNHERGDEDEDDEKDLKFKEKILEVD